ncbi:transglycosylase SLT domain-containing protein [Photobacterium japonica]|uniref:transglycosylase SLT domain-containing protein n=1 Tax=Photobacterium japonica TaxID=2910235 RepID=UPI003D0BBF19
MIVPYLFLASIVVLIAGCQNISAHIEQPEATDPPDLTEEQALASAHTLSVDTLNHRCPISSELFEGSYIATGENETRAQSASRSVPLITNAETPPVDTSGITSKQAQTTQSTKAIQAIPPPWPHEVLPPALPQEAPEIWEVLSSQFSMNVPNNRRINQHKRWFINNPYHIETVTARAEPFLYYLYQQVKARDLPIELALLPFIESSFDQFAHSHKGAAGLWQITAPTGRTFGLTITSGYDGRRDIVASTQAALDLLEYLYERFDKNWLHAIAAYNTGGARVRNAIKKNRAAGKSTDFWALKLPRETRHYVPKLLAMAELVKQRQQYPLTFASIKAEPQVEEVVIQKRIRLKHLAGYAGMSSKTLYHLNPGYTGGYTMKKTENTILLPVAHRTTFYDNEKSKKVTKQSFVVYDIQAGDSLNQLARLNNTSVDMIKQVNHLSHSFIVAGQTILIPE